MFKLLSSQRGAMFSMDTRVALVIVSVLAGVVGTQVVSKIEKNRVESSDIGVQKIADALEEMFISTPGIDRTNFVNYTVLIPRTTVNLRDWVNGRVVTGNDVDYLKDSSLEKDPWGHDWMFGMCNTTINVGGTLFGVDNVVIYSSGPDKNYDSGISSDDGTTSVILRKDTEANCITDYTNWKPMSDDIGVKFSTIEHVKKAALETHRRAATVQKRLQEYERTLRIENKIFCATTANPELLHPRCDFNNDGAYQPGEEQNLNYFPNSIHDANDGVIAPNNYYYIPHGRAAVAPELDEVNDSDLLTLLNLPPSKYNTFPDLRRLCYRSNYNNVLKAPFTVKISYVTNCP